MTFIKSKHLNMPATFSTIFATKFIFRLQKIDILMTIVRTTFTALRIHDFESFLLNLRFSFPRLSLYFTSTCTGYPVFYSPTRSQFVVVWSFRNWESMMKISQFQEKNLARSQLFIHYFEIEKPTFQSSQ